MYSFPDVVHIGTLLRRVLSFDVIVLTFQGTRTLVLFSVYVTAIFCLGSLRKQLQFVLF